MRFAEAVEDWRSSLETAVTGTGRRAKTVATLDRELYAAAVTTTIDPPAGYPLRPRNGDWTAAIGGAAGF